jgi:hypothetical protein
MKYGFQVLNLLLIKIECCNKSIEIIPGGQHNETAWRLRLPAILKFLFLGT